MISMSASSLSRRELFVLAARAGIGAAAVAALPRAAFGGLQAGVTGKHSSLIARSARPVDFETPVELLDSFITPNEAFFVRGHMTAPAVDPQTWQLSVEGDGRAPRTLSVADLRALPAVSVTATIECAGNGRAFFDPPVAGIQWRKGAVGTSRWTGARLRDVVAVAGGRHGRGLRLDVGWRPPARHAAPLRAPGAVGEGDGRRHHRRLRDGRPADSAAARCTAARDRSRVGKAPTR